MLKPEGGMACRRISEKRLPCRNLQASYYGGPLSGNLLYGDVHYYRFPFIIYYSTLDSLKFTLLLML